MTTRSTLRALLLATAALSPAPSAAQTLRGILIERDTYQVIELGTVYMLTMDGDTVAATLSDENGVFHMTAPESGSYRLVAHALGYVPGGAGPFDLEEDALRIVQLALLPAPVPIEGLDVETSRLVISDDVLLANGFYERMLAGRGQFLTPEDVERSPARYTPQLFRGLEYVRPQYGATPWKTWVQLWSPHGGGRNDANKCTPRIWVDDVWVNRPGYEQFTDVMGMEDVVPRESIKAVELYWALQGPWKYRAPVSPEPVDCGVVVIWTKTGS